MANQTTTHLEPRVARLETSMEALTRNVDSLSTNVSQLTKTIDEKFSALQVGLANAQAPRRTDWGVLLSAGTLILALGAAVLIPINNASNDNKSSVQRLEQKFDEHAALPLHPIGQALVNGMQKLMDEREANYQTQHKLLDEKIQRETQLMTDLVSAKLIALDERLQKEMSLRDLALQTQLTGIVSKQELVNQRHFERIVRLETYNSEQISKDNDELRQWRVLADHGEVKINTPVTVCPQTSGISVVPSQPTK
jgi:hypothetical protein